MTSKNTKQNNAIIKIKNNQTFAEDTDTIEITTEGRFALRNGSFYILYDEYSELGDVHVMLKAKENTATIKKSGATCTTMEYIPGESREVPYKIPYGEMYIGLKTESVKNSLNINGGVLELNYSININNEIYFNNMTVEVKLN